MRDWSEAFLDNFFRHNGVDFIEYNHNVVLLEETDDYNIYEAIIPRFDKDEVSISYKDDVINKTVVVIKAKNSDYVVDENFRIPFKCEKIMASLKNGVLTLKAYKDVVKMKEKTVVIE